VPDPRPGPGPAIRKPIDGRFLRSAPWSGQLEEIPDFKWIQTSTTSLRLGSWGHNSHSIYDTAQIMYDTDPEAACLITFGLCQENMFHCSAVFVFVRVFCVYAAASQGLTCSASFVVALRNSSEAIIRFSERGRVEYPWLGPPVNGRMRGENVFGQHMFDFVMRVLLTPTITPPTPPDPTQPHLCKKPFLASVHLTFAIKINRSGKKFSLGILNRNKYMPSIHDLEYKSRDDSDDQTFPFMILYRNTYKSLFRKIKCDVIKSK
jgi:hypothetical protein